MAVFYNNTATSTTGWYVPCNSTTGAITNFSTQGCVVFPSTVVSPNLIGNANIVQGQLKVGNNQTIELPDGSKLVTDDKGNHKIEDRDAKVTYQANRVREFNPYINASDLLAKFVGFVGGLGVRQAEVLGLPIELFINWLVIEAAEKDKDPIPDGIVAVEQHKEVRSILKPQCRKCGRFVPVLHSRNRFPFCNAYHAADHIAKIGMKMNVPQLVMAN